MDWFVGLVLVIALIYWFFNKEPEEAPKTYKSDFVKRSPNRAVSAQRTEPTTIKFTSDSLKDLLCEMAVAAREEQDTPNAYVQIMVEDGRFFGMNAVTFNAALASYKPMIKAGNALQRRADRLKYGSAKGPEIAGEMEVMAAELRPHIRQIEAAIDIVFSDKDAPMDKIFNLLDTMDGICYDLEQTAVELRSAI